MLAANGILYQMFILSALILDGFESAAQVLCGEAVGARDRASLRRGWSRALLLWGLAVGAPVQPGLCARRRAASPPASAPIRRWWRPTLAYLPWAVLLPLLGVTAYVFDGIYIGATWTRALLLTMAAAFAVYARAAAASPARSAITACGSPSACSCRPRAPARRCCCRGSGRRPSRPAHEARVARKARMAHGFTGGRLPEQRSGEEGKAVREQGELHEHGRAAYRVKSKKYPTIALARGRCFAETDLMTSRCSAAGSNGGSELASASAISASMRGSSSVATAWQRDVADPAAARPRAGRADRAGPCPRGSRASPSAERRRATGSPAPASRSAPKPIASAL